jgi:hypothetical protein
MAGISAKSTRGGRERGLASVRVQGIPVRRWLRTTPGRLRTLSIALVFAAVAVGAIAWTTAQARHGATREVGVDATPQLGASEALYAALADADAAASTAYLEPGNDDPSVLRRYDRDISTAGQSFATVGREVGDRAEARRALATISKQLPVYTGLIEAARANNRQGFAVGAAYLRQASALMQDTVLPAATVLYEQSAQRLDDAYGRGTDNRDFVWLAVAGVATLALFVGACVYLARRTRRLLNVGVVAGFVLLAILFGWTVAQFATAQSSLVDAQRHGSDAVQTLSSARILLLRAYNDDNLALVARGNGADYVQDFDTVAKVLTATKSRQPGLLHTAGAIAGRTSDVDLAHRLVRQFASVQQAHDAVRGNDDAGSYGDAVKAATTTERQAVSTLDDTLQREIARTQAILAARAADARGGYTVMLVLLPLLALGAAVAVLAGLTPRIEEYR